MSRVFIACGGTGGHLSPGIALGQGMRSRDDEPKLLISQKRIDARLASRYQDLDFQPVPGRPFSVNPLRWPGFVGGLVRGTWFSWQMMRRQRPDLVFGFGGFSNVPVLIAATLARIPFVLHEANRVPGRTIRLFGPGARRVYLPPGILMGKLRLSRIRHAGYPLRRELHRITRAKAREELGLNPSQPVLVVLGGSQGAEVLNRWVRQNLDALVREGVQIYCVTGPGKGAAGSFENRSRHGQKVKAIFTPFTDRMAHVLSAGDLAVARAGAGTLAELIRCRLPAILVPLPGSADNHQEANARFFERQGAGLVVSEAFLGDLLAEVRDVVFNDWLLGCFQANQERLDREDALKVILDDLAALLRERENPSTPADQPAVA
ncbi:MAG: UDP-N-acetylglucosamine--N-acetylmuramyl-(pentapeptide) pyrophosphoryl-undecaprenol N-acetylglucosamine transferase [Puniceicoccaceae bacterium]|nr:MAG: UDP-N-acetylglucosamine--N-acetylmuramyl-(pentapeptide) pyrophosphoryl-undecaprenol N-acetylglucosamine transferase [Puniceicoccaceae bacterium]